MMTIKQLESFGLKKDMGMESYYYQIDLLHGIKVYKQPMQTKSAVFRTEEECRDSDSWKEVVRQVSMMNFFAARGRGPKVFEVFVVHDESINFYFPSIKVEHIEIKHFRTGDHKERAILRAKDKILSRISDMVIGKINYGDLHDGNFVFNETTHKFVFIDFGVIFQVDEERNMIKEPMAA